MTDSQVTAAAARCWIDSETPVRKPQSSEWTKLGDVAPAKRITEDTSDIDTSAMILLSGEFEVVDDASSPTKDELAAARPPRLAPKLFALAIVMLAGGGVLARRHLPKLDSELDGIVAAMRPAPIPTVSPSPAVQAPAPAPAPVAMTVTSSATLSIVPKMRAPAPRMREPSAPPTQKKAAAHAKAKPAHAAHRH